MRMASLPTLICLPLLLSCGERQQRRLEVEPHQPTVNSAPQSTRSTDSLVAKEKAVNLTKEPARKLLGRLDKFDVTTSALDDGWVVTYQWKDKSVLVDGGHVEYFVDKEGEKITDIRLHQ